MWLGDGCQELSLGGAIYGSDCMVVCNDWHSALVPMLIHAEKTTTGAWEFVRAMGCWHYPSICGFPKSWGYPKNAGWFLSWKIPWKWMMTRGTPISRNLHILPLSLNFWRFLKGGNSAETGARSMSIYFGPFFWMDALSLGRGCWCLNSKTLMKSEHHEDLDSFSI